MTTRVLNNSTCDYILGFLDYLSISPSISSSADSLLNMCKQSFAFRPQPWCVNSVPLGYLPPLPYPVPIPPIHQYLTPSHPIPSPPLTHYHPHLLISAQRPILPSLEESGTGRGAHHQERGHRSS